MGSVYRSSLKTIWDIFGPYANRAPQIAPSAQPTIQTTFPTSAYGQTIPVVYGKFRAPGGYVWAPAISTTIDGDTINVILTARVRFGRPLVDNSGWRLRRLWAGGTLIYDAANGVRSPLIWTLREYDGQTTQGRDPTMVDIEGEDEVSAHRGYLDIVIKMDLGAQADAPPVFDAEWVQGESLSYDDDAFTSLLGGADGFAMLDTASDGFYALSNPPGGPFHLRKFSISALQEIYAIPISGASSYGLLANEGRFLPSIDRVITIGRASAIWPILIDPATGVITATADFAASSSGLGQFLNTALAIMFSSTAGVYLTSAFHVGEFATFQFTENSITRTSLSGSAWDGRGVVTCMALGEVGGNNATIYAIVDGTTVYKLTITASGQITGISTFATLGSNADYILYRDGEVYVWDSSAQLIRYNATTGATVATYSLPYQIDGSDREIPPADMQVIDDRIFVPGGSNYYLTNLGTGETETFTKIHSGEPFQVWNDDRKTIITTSSSETYRTVLDVAGDGTIRDLDDFIGAIWESGGDYASSEHDETGIDDQIQGGVIDVTQGKREVVRSIAEPYSASIFERGDQIITKRAATDGGFVVDATIAASDIVDRGGQAIRARRLNPEEFVARYGINYRDPDEIYQPRPQFGEIPFVPFPVSPTDFSVKADVPVIVDGDTIKTLATKKVNRLAVERHEFTMALRAKFSDLEPEDILQFPYANRTVTARSTETAMNPDFTIEVKCTEFLPTVAVSVSGATGRPTVPSAAGTPASAYYHLDIPLQADSHDLDGGGLVQYHVLTSKGQANWDGATLYRESVPVSAQTEVGLVGVALTQLADADNPYVTEFTRTVDVAFITGDASTISTKTYLEVMEGANKFAIGAPGRWEVCHVITITNNGDGSYTFEGLVRGRGTSEEFTGDHAVGDYVVWLSDDNVQHLGYSIDSLNDAFSFKAVGIGGTLSSTAAVSRTVTGEAEKIPKPCQLDAVIDGSDIDLSWVRRSRIGVIWADDGDFSTPLGESLEQYVLRIKDGPGGTVLRTFTVDDATTKTYLSADITTDFGSMPSELTFDIRQVSGTGVICPTREATITL